MQKITMKYTHCKDRKSRLKNRDQISIVDRIVGKKELKSSFL
ncbi:MAG: hypothetical protein AAFX55_09060 [Bacteroidota bacterium]